MTFETLSANDVQRMLSDGDELALIDVREELLFSKNHLLHARCLSLSRLELKIARLVPRRSVRIVLCDANDGLSERAAQVLAKNGYTNIFILKGGVESWADAGLEVFSGVNVPSKAFGEFVERTSETPSIEAHALYRLLEEKSDVVILDSRPHEEYSHASIPTAINVPGAELVLRVRDLVPSPDTRVIVNCAGRTRSIIGAQSLIDAGLPNPTFALRNGTMGWSLAGLECEPGRRQFPGRPSDASVAWATTAAERVRQRIGVQHIDVCTLDRFRSEMNERTLYILDVRDTAEYERGHIADAISAPGGQLIQATDQYVGTLNARLVIVDDLTVRAVMTASWLVRMGWKEVFVLSEVGNEVGWPAPQVLGTYQDLQAMIDPPSLRALVDAGNATVIDLSLSRVYRAGHIPNAWFAIRSRLRQALDQIKMTGENLVLTSEDGIVAGLAVEEARSLSELSVLYLAGGNAAWAAAGYPLEISIGNFADKPVDVWLKPHERSINTRAEMSKYLTWEVGLLESIDRDGTCDFRTIGMK